MMIREIYFAAYFEINKKVFWNKCWHYKSLQDEVIILTFKIQDSVDSTDKRTVLGGILNCDKKNTS